MSIEKVRKYFSRWNMEDRIIELDSSSATVELAAQALHCEENRIAKTLSFTLPDEYILVVVAGAARIDNHKYKETFGVKAKMLPFEEVESKIGHAVGGVCPFGNNEGVKVYLDCTLQHYETVYPACGSENSAICLTIPELEKYSCFEKWVDVCKNDEQTQN